MPIEYKTPHTSNKIKLIDGIFLIIGTIAIINIHPIMRYTMSIDWTKRIGAMERMTTPMIANNRMIPKSTHHNHHFTTVKRYGV
ncbi:MAG: hypothetical protein WCJ45_02015 [bacterium]